MFQPLLDTRKYALITGGALAGLGILGAIAMMVDKPKMLGADLFVFDWAQVGVHVVLGMAALFVGMDMAPRFCDHYAKGAGVAYALVGLAGLLFWDGWSDERFHLELGEDLAHLAIGAWGAAAGFWGTTESLGLSQKPYKPPTETPPPAPREPTAPVAPEPPGVPSFRPKM